MERFRTVWLGLPIRTKGFLVVALPTAAALLVTLLFGLALERAGATELTVSSSYEVRLALDDVLEDLVNAETGVRGFALTHEPHYFEPYRAGVGRLYGDIRDLESLLSEPWRSTTRGRLQPLLTERLILFRLVIDTSRAGNSATSTLFDRGKAVMDEIRAALDVLERHETRVLRERLDRAAAADRFAVALALGGLGAGLLGGAAAVLLFASGVSGRVLQIRAGAQALIAEETVDTTIVGSDEIADAGKALSEAASMLAERAAALRASQQELRLVVDRLAEGVVLAGSDGKFRLFNPAAEEILGLGLMDVDPQEWSRTYGVYRADGETLYPSAELPLARALIGESTDQVEMIARTPHRGDAWLTVSGRPVVDEGGDVIGGVVVFADITERKRFEFELARLAAVDELTGLLNRRGFADTAGRELGLAQRSHRPAVILFIEVDGLKAVNDTLGHEEGSRLLADVAGILVKASRSSDVVGRVGGDEFCVLAVGQPPAATLGVEQRIREGLRAFNDRSMRPYKVAVSIGSATSDPERPASLDTLIAEADERMYAEKNRRRAVR
jgi:diguanylate cyclase (GGDEF)-like protein/PAS domain S-box-containing protein